MSTSAGSGGGALAARRTLADVLPGGLLRDATLIAATVAILAVTAQVKFSLPFTPVPLTLQTFAVLLTGAALGGRRAVISMALYVGLGVAGVGWFADQSSGWAFASFGYLIGFVVAGYLVGRLAERGADRTPLRTAGLMVVGNLVIYALGVPWLMAFADVGFATALVLGVVPFLIGDALKIALAAGLLPAGWAVIRRRER